MVLKLSEKQKQIVDFTDGALLVKAGPGSGKTRVLIERIKKLLNKHRRCKILALTFSNLAAEEMKARLEEDGTLEELIDNVTVGTIHSFALDLVQRRANLIGLPEELTLFENNTDRQNMLREILMKNSLLARTLSYQEKPEKFLDNILSEIASQKKKFVSPEMYEGDETFKEVYREYNQYLIQQNAIDYDDILFYAYRILMENPSVQNMYASLYRYICVDESQDLNFAQYELIKALCGNGIKNVMFVGDANQSIYGFNGSNSDLMTKNFVDDFNPRVFELYENFRSARRIVAYANRLENTDSQSNYFYEGILEAFQCENEELEAEFIVEKIHAYQKEGHPDIEKLPVYEDFAVIARNRYALTNIENKLKQQEIPCYYKKTINGIENESDYMKIFDLTLRVFSNPLDLIHLRELCSLVKCEVPDTDKDSIPIILKDDIYEGIRKALNYMSDDNFDFGKGLKEIRSAIENASIDDDDKYLILSDIEEWNKHWIKYTFIVSRENRSLVSFRNCIALGKTQDISGDKGISLLTAHMSKGLQYEIVFVIGMTEGTFPDYRAVIKEGKEMEQEKNNMFVAVTRAKRICILTYPSVKKMPWGGMKEQERSRFLEDVSVTVVS